jgi:RHS repeat-associated protein
LHVTTGTFIQLSNPDLKVDYYTAEIVKSTEYSCYGVELSGWGYVSVDSYRFGYNGMESCDEANAHLTEFRMLDARLGRWWSIDPLSKEYLWQSPYCAFDNSPVILIDPSGAGTGGPFDTTVEDFNQEIQAETRSSYQRALDVLDYYQKNSFDNQSVFPNISKDELINHLRAIIRNNGEPIQQSHNTCGIAAIEKVFVETDPYGFVMFTLDLFRYGYATHLSYSITKDDGIKQWALTVPNAKDRPAHKGADIIFQGSIRVAENSDGKFNPKSDWDGFTTPTEITKLGSDLLGMNVETEYTHFWTKLSDSQTKINNGSVYVIVLNNGTLFGDVFDPWHYWVLNSYKSVDSIKFNAGMWNYGKTDYVNLNVMDVAWSFENLFFLTKK